jgi:hypothetical protein
MLAKCKPLPLGLAIWLTGMLTVGLPVGCLQADDGTKPPAGQTEQKQGEPKAKPKAKMVEPDTPEEQDTKSKFKTRGAPPPPPRMPEVAPAKPGGSRIGGQTIRGKETEE